MSPSTANVGDTGYGMGAVAADYDNDGDTDIYVVNFGRDVLYRNNGDGTFTDVTASRAVSTISPGARAPHFSMRTAMATSTSTSQITCSSLSRRMSTAAHRVRASGRTAIRTCTRCRPISFTAAMAREALRTRPQAAGLLDTSGHGKGLGVVAADLDDDGDADIYVANDSTPNYLYRNLGDGQFEEVGLFTGTSHNDDGMTEAGMGTDAGDVNGDGWLDLIVTNLSAETNSLYLGGEDFFDYGTRAAGLYEGSLMQVGFGVDFLDIDNDTDLDLFVTNGHVIDNIELTDDSQSFRQPSQLFLNDGSGSFQPGRARPCRRHRKAGCRPGHDDVRLRQRRPPGRRRYEEQRGRQPVPQRMAQYGQS